MHVHAKALHARAVRRRDPILVALAIATTTMLAACSGDGPSAGPRPSREGQLVQVTGTTEFSVRAAAGAPARVIHRGSFTSSGTMTSGVARADFQLRALDRRVERDDPRASPGDRPDSATITRILDQAGAQLLPALAIDEGSRLAAFGTSSVVESVIRDGQGNEARLVAISDLQRGPLTDFLVVRNGRPVRYNRVEWVRSGGTWTATSAASVALLDNGGALVARTRTGGPRFASADTVAPLSLAAIAGRIEEIQFGALARRAFLPAAAHAQGSGDWTPPQNFSCDKFRNPLVSYQTPCQAYAFNSAIIPLVWLAGLIPTISAAQALGMLVTGNLPALLEALAVAAGAVAAFAPEILQGVAVAMAVAYLFSYVDCRSNKVESAKYCAKIDPRAPAGGGTGTAGSDAYADTGVTSDACGLFCDPSRRGMIDAWREGLRAAE
ncbi:MAG: hypothetical protein HYX65_08320 [Gemmatimonadetes bacterium]|nr:hypothetical protein [Gemmatimonadota bacterium]